MTFEEALAVVLLYQSNHYIWLPEPERKILDEAQAIVKRRGEEIMARETAKQAP